MSGWRLVEDRGRLRLEAAGVAPVFVGTLVEWRRVRSLLRVALGDVFADGAVGDLWGDGVAGAFTRSARALVVSLHCGDSLLLVEGARAVAELHGGLMVALSGVSADGSAGGGGN